MSTKQEQLKDINAKKKQLAAEQKALRDQINEGKEERKEATKAKSDSRKAFTEAKSELRAVLAKSYGVLKDCDSEEIGEYADEITEISAKLATSARACSEAVKALDAL